MYMFSIFLISAKSNDITNIIVKPILLQKIALTSIYDIIMSPEHFERLASLKAVKIDMQQHNQTFDGI